MNTVDSFIQGSISHLGVCDVAGEIEKFKKKMNTVNSIIQDYNISNRSIVAKKNFFMPGHRRGKDHSREHIIPLGRVRRPR